MHRAVWHDGREVAVKLQYPGAGPALLSDLNQLARFARLFAVLNPGLDVKPLIRELKDPGRRGARLRAGGASHRPRSPRRTTATPTSSFRRSSSMPAMSSSPNGSMARRCRRSSATARPEERNRAGLLFVRFLLSGPERAGLLHADPHPGNFRLTADDKLAVLDYGAVNRLPDGLPTTIGPLGGSCWRAGPTGARRSARRRIRSRRPRGRRAGGARLRVTDAGADHAAEHFHFTRPWLRREAARVADPRSPANQLGRQLNLPPTYLLMHRVSAGIIGVLCQLDADIPYGAEVRRWLPGLADPAPAIAKTSSRSSAARPRALKRGRVGSAGCAACD